MRPSSALSTAASWASVLHCFTILSVTIRALVSRWKISGCGALMVKKSGLMPSLLAETSCWPILSTEMAISGMPAPSWWNRYSAPPPATAWKMGKSAKGRHPRQAGWDAENQSVHIRPPVLPWPKARHKGYAPCRHLPDCSICRDRSEGCNDEDGICPEEVGEPATLVAG